MKLTKITSASLVCLLVVGQAFAAAEITLKKDQVRGMKDGQMTTISKSEIARPNGENIEAEKVGPFYQFTHNGSTYKLRVSDVNVIGSKRACLPGETKVIAENASIGGTQMGSGAYDCE